MNTGIKTITLTDEKLASFYEGRYTPELELNQYLFIENKEGKVIDKKKQTREGIDNLKYKNINNDRFGKVKPVNNEQEALFDLLQNKEITVKEITGVAGAGKNYCTMTYALDEIDKWEKGKSDYRKIVMVRNNIEVKDTYNIGALPAGINEKLLPFAMPAVDIIGSQTELFELITAGKIELLHLGFARGRSFSNSIIIVDECENITGEHAALLLSRVAENSVIIFLGDTGQIDKNTFEKNSGLDKLNSKLFGHKLYGSVQLIKTERSETASLSLLL